jgi:dTDP-4-amino-4,6-dideoxygalactose transaminase
VRFEIPFIRPNFPNSVLIGKDFEDIAASNWYTNFGPKEREFRGAITRYVGDGRIAITFANATLALMAIVHTALGQGDNSRYVIVPSFTFAAGASAIEWAGYLPLFIDIDRDTLQPSLAEASAAIHEHKRDIAGILLCNTFGIGNVEIDAWENLASRSGIPLIIDSAAGFGSRYGGERRLGTAGLAEVFSFHATKPFAIGEGGAILTSDEQLAESLQSFQNFGFKDGKGAIALGLNGKLQEINAAIGLRQLTGFDDAIRSRQAVVEAYRAGLQDTGIRLPIGIEHSSVCFASLLYPNEAARDHAMEVLTASGIEIRKYYSPPIHRQPHFEGADRIGDLSRTDIVVDTILSVPVYTNMDDSIVRAVVAAIRAGS